MQTAVEVTVLGSGSSGNATVIRCGDDAILIDAGFSGAELQRRLDTAGVAAARIRGILISHASVKTFGSSIVASYIRWLGLMGV